MNRNNDQTGGAALALDFEQVLNEEQAAGCRPPGQSIGLAFSGGGIRSATFNLGVIQALSECHLLRRFDYLSTISGGGYIGAWLSTFIKRQAGGEVEVAEDLIHEKENGVLEHPAVRFLRSYSNYLTPRTGFSMDTLIAVATYLRNLLLNLLILAALACAALILPRIVVGIGRLLYTEPGFQNQYLWVMLALLVPPAFIVALNLLYRAGDSRLSLPWFTKRRPLMILLDLPVVAAAFCAATYYAWAMQHWPPEQEQYNFGPWFLTMVGVYVALWAIGLGFALLLNPASRTQFRRAQKSFSALGWFLAFLLCGLIAGMAGSGILIGIVKAIGAVDGGDMARQFVAVALGTPAIVVAFMLTLVVHIGLMSRKFGESDRELWSVFGARLMRVSLVWTVVFCIALYGPAAIEFADEWVVRLGGGAWIIGTLFGVFAGKSEATGKDGNQKGRRAGVELLTRIAPYVFVLGLLLTLSYGVHRAILWSDDAYHNRESKTVVKQPRWTESGIYLKATPQTGAPVVTVRDLDAPSLWHEFQEIVQKEYKALKTWFSPAWVLPAVFLASLLAAGAISWRVNINLFSLHHFYRNRLMRAYLGATNRDRRPQPLTGFDENDDVEMTELIRQKPFHIVGTAINLNRGRQLAWQNRRAASFTFTPLHAGYEPASRFASGGYRPAAEYGKDAEQISLPLGTAIAISGAAASPNQGYHTSPAVAFLLTVFNVRLGHWCGDTKDPDDAWRRRDPRFSLRYWLAELTGSADDDYPFVSLSDGGHFENLGVYELVRRRCGLIVACDAGADPDYSFEDLAEAIRKCYTDFGVTIDFKGFDVEAIRPRKEDKSDDAFSERHCAIATIRYPDDSAGTLLYLKSSLTGNLPPDIMHYKRTHKNFPHESTVDQFFDESQFESYRHLGYEAAKRSLDLLTGNGRLPPQLA